MFIDEKFISEFFSNFNIIKNLSENYRFGYVNGYGFREVTSFLNIPTRKLFKHSTCITKSGDLYHFYYNDLTFRLMEVNNRIIIISSWIGNYILRFSTASRIGTYQIHVNENLTEDELFNFEISLDGIQYELYKKTMLMQTEINKINTAN